MNVTTQVLEFLMLHDDGLTVDECKERFGTHELRAIVAHAAKKGFIFDKTWEFGTNRYGKPSKWLRYRFSGIQREIA